MKGWCFFFVVVFCCSCQQVKKELSTLFGGPPCGARFDPQLGSCGCEGPGEGAVWGSGLYTADSAVCRAAVHAGAIPSTGGTIAPVAAPGCPGYVGSTRNGVQTQSWDAYGSSFYFPGHGDSRCPPVAPRRPPPPPDAVKVEEGGACPPQITAFAAFEQKERFSCYCPPGDVDGGSVWGSGIYTTDSDLCRAAVHAGAVGEAGGDVVVVKAPGCASYVGTVAHGVTTTAWGSYQQSFTFASKEARCAP